MIGDYLGYAALLVTFLGSTYGFVVQLLNFREQHRRAALTDALSAGEAKVLEQKAEVLESEAQTGIAEASNKLAEASNKLADSTGKIADVSQRLIDQLSLALTKSEEARRVAESELAISRKAAADELRALRGDYNTLVIEFAEFKKSCDADKLRLELAIGHLQSEIEKMHKNTPE